jgi:nicotinate-nucleotide pyrophosphorylase (carboxylating)
MKVEVECQSQEEAEQALEAGADVVMLDNFDPEKLKKVAKNLKQKFPHSLIEASGGVTLETLANYFSEDVDIISMGNLTQGVPHVDFSLKIKH